ncbi:MAG: hypothetical protein LBH38_03670 [Holosporales bacterium]|jgi:hypothetical protein|nr:hypothetical protein [Holosporales bacterium]
MDAIKTIHMPSVWVSLLLHGPLYGFQDKAWVRTQFNRPYDYVSGGYGITLILYGTFLTLIGVLYALGGFPKFFEKASFQKDSKSLTRCALLLHTLGFILVYALFHLETRYVMSSTFLLGFLGWWAVADFMNARRKM